MYTSAFSSSVVMCYGIFWPTWTCQIINVQIHSKNPNSIKPIITCLMQADSVGISINGCVCLCLHDSASPCGPNVVFQLCAATGCGLFSTDVAGRTSVTWSPPVRVPAAHCAWTWMRGCEASPLVCFQTARPERKASQLPACVCAYVCLRPTYVCIVAHLSMF